MVGSVCNNKQRWSKVKRGCECKELIDAIGAKLNVDVNVKNWLTKVDAIKRIYLES